MGMVADEMKIGRGAEAKDCTDKKESEDNSVFCAVTYARRRAIALAQGGCGKHRRADDVGNHIHGLIVEIAETGDGFPVIV